MKTLQFHFSDTRKGLPIEKPDEDYLMIDGNTFVVADGVTLMWKLPYPNPSPAFEAAKICCNSIIDFINKNNIEVKNLIFEAISKANEDINKFNIENNITPDTIDYINTQYASTVCSAGLIKDGYLYYGNINDCGIKVFNEKNELIADLMADTEFHEEYLNHLRSLNIYKTPQEEHIYFRKNVVNKDIEFKGKSLNFGVLTGESTALDFIKTGSIKIDADYKIIFYSDGFYPHMKDQSFLEKLLDKNTKDIQEYIENFSSKNDVYRKEKSVIIVYL